jgi:hypothetical protein
VTVGPTAPIGGPIAYVVQFTESSRAFATTRASATTAALTKAAPAATAAIEQVVTTAATTHRCT